MASPLNRLTAFTTVMRKLLAEISAPSSTLWKQTSGLITLPVTHVILQMQTVTTRTVIDQEPVTLTSTISSQTLTLAQVPSTRSTLNKSSTPKLNSSKTMTESSQSTQSYFLKMGVKSS